VYVPGGVGSGPPRGESAAWGSSDEPDTCSDTSVFGVVMDAMPVPGVTGARGRPDPQATRSGEKVEPLRDAPRLYTPGGIYKVSGTIR